MYLGHPDAAYDLDEGAQARLLAVMWAEHRLGRPKPKDTDARAMMAKLSRRGA